jgi:hypothetical protein
MAPIPKKATGICVKRDVPPLFPCTDPVARPYDDRLGSTPGGIVPALRFRSWGTAPELPAQEGYVASVQPDCRRNAFSHATCNYVESYIDRVRGSSRRKSSLFAIFVYSCTICYCKFQNIENLRTASEFGGDCMMRGAFIGGQQKALFRPGHPYGTNASALF